MKLSFIVLTYNNLAIATQPMVESLLPTTPQRGTELIVVDNHSSDGTLEYFSKLQQSNPAIKIIANPENLGFSKGMNQGLAAAQGDVLILMNNDILFSTGWLELFLAVIRRPEVGLVSPQVNRLGDGCTAENFQTRAAKCRLMCDDFVYQWFIPFCCVGLRREVFEKIGFLDEAFTPAYFEDNDYCLRSLYAGYKNAIALKSFVYHNHCQTTGQMADRKLIFERNQRQYYQKHLLGQYIDQLESSLKLLRKKTLQYRAKKWLIRLSSWFILNPKKRKLYRKSLEFKFGL